MKRIVSFYLNGMETQAMAKPETTLLEMLRDELDLTSPKCGCNHGDCGTCTVILDGKSVKSCMVLALTVGGKRIVTVDGLAGENQLHPLQQAFYEYGAPQCGFCTPGMVIAATAYLLENPSPTEEEVKEALSGNLCRCGGYKKYVTAVMAAARGEFGPLPKGSEMNV